MRLRPASVAVLAAVALALGTLVPASADDDVDRKAKVLKRQLAATQSDIEALSVQAEKAAAAWTSARAALPAAQAEVARATSALTAARAVDQALAVQLQAAVEDERRTQAEVDAVVVRMEQTRRLVGQLARRAYQNGQFAELAVALEAESIDEFAGRIAGIQAVAQSQNGLFDRLAVDRAELAAKRSELEAIRAGVAEKKAAAAAQVTTVRTLLRRAQAAQARVARLVATREAALRSVQAARAQELRRAAALRAEQRRVAAIIAARTSRGSGAIGGELAWPVPGGGLTMKAGPRIHPVYGYRSCHTGIDIGGGYGARIIAPAAGTVVAVYPSNAYGNVTVVDHGNGLSTFFAHQSSRTVSQGERVSRGQTIGYTGSTGWVTGPHLHFEVHVNGQPYDPLGWLGMGAKKPIVC